MNFDKIQGCLGGNDDCRLIRSPAGLFGVAYMNQATPAGVPCWFARDNSRQVIPADAIVFVESD